MGVISCIFNYRFHQIFTVNEFPSQTLLTVADDSTERISFEVKLNVHVLPLLMRVQHLELKACITLNLIYTMSWAQNQTHELSSLHGCH